MGQSIKPWIGLAGFVALIIMVAGWFLVISPTRAATADVRANIEMESNKTTALTAALEKLEAQFKTLDKSRAELDELSLQLPSSADASAFRRLIDARAVNSGVTVMSVTTGVSTTITEPAAPVAPVDPDLNTEASAPVEPTPSPEPTPGEVTGVTTASGQMLVGIPLEITLVGTYDATRAFIASLQTTEGRLFLVSGLGMVTQLSAPQEGGRPETNTGDVELSVQGFLLVLTANASDVVNPSEAPSPAPLPSTERNPFAPVGVAPTEE